MTFKVQKDSLTFLKVYLLETFYSDLAFKDPTNQFTTSTKIVNILIEIKLCINESKVRLLIAAAAMNDFELLNQFLKFCCFRLQLKTRWSSDKRLNCQFSQHGDQRGGRGHCNGS